MCSAWSRISRAAAAASWAHRPGRCPCECAHKQIWSRAYEVPGGRAASNAARPRHRAHLPVLPTSSASTSRRRAWAHPRLGVRPGATPPPPRSDRWRARWRSRRGGHGAAHARQAGGSTPRSRMRCAVDPRPPVLGRRDSAGAAREEACHAHDGAPPSTEVAPPPAVSDDGPVAEVAVLAEMGSSSVQAGRPCLVVVGQIPTSDLECRPPPTGSGRRPSRRRHPRPPAQPAQLCLVHVASSRRQARCAPRPAQPTPRVIRRLDRAQVGSVWSAPRHGQPGLERDNGLRMCDQMERISLLQACISMCPVLIQPCNSCGWAGTPVTASKE